MGNTFILNDYNSILYNMKLIQIFIFLNFYQLCKFLYHVFFDLDTGKQQFLKLQKKTFKN